MHGSARAVVEFTLPVLPFKITHNAMFVWLGVHGKWQTMCVVRHAMYHAPMPLKARRRGTGG